MNETNISFLVLFNFIYLIAAVVFRISVLVLCSHCLYTLIVAK